MVHLFKPLFKGTQSKDRRKNTKNDDRDDLLLKLSDHDREILQHVQKWVTRWESSTHFLGRRWGLGSVVGLVPVIGDICNVAFAIYIVRECGKIDNGLSFISSARIAVNIALYFVIGIPPFLGDLADSLIKFNTRNGNILEQDLLKKVRRREKESRAPAISD